MFVDMLNVQKEAKYDMSTLETGIIGGAPAPEELCKNLIEIMNMEYFAVWHKNYSSIFLDRQYLMLPAGVLWHDRGRLSGPPMLRK